MNTMTLLAHRLGTSALPVLLLVVSLNTAHAAPAETDAALAVLPAGGVRIATLTPNAEGGVEGLQIHELGPLGLNHLGTATGTWDELVWVDRDHLFALQTVGVEAPHLIRGTLLSANGQVKGEPMLLTTDELGATAADPGDRLGGDYTVELGLDAKRRPWVRLCVARKRGVEFTELDDCARFAYGRLDPLQRRVAERKTSKPKGFTLLSDLTDGLALAKVPKVAAPEGYKATERKVRAESGPPAFGARVRVVTCVGPGSEVAEPDVADWPLALAIEKVRWVMADPPLLSLSGRTIDPVGNGSRTELVIRGCSDKLEAVRFFTPRVWASWRSGEGETSGWDFFVGSKPIGFVRAFAAHPNANPFRVHHP